MKFIHCLFLVLVMPLALDFANAQTLPMDERPEWLHRDGIVMAGSWEALVYRVRRDGDDFSVSDEQRKAYELEHSPEMADRLKSLGVNFIMTHCYKGAGLEMEREGMEDAARFAQICRDKGMRTGVYNYSGAMLWEQTMKEVPQAKDWFLLDENGDPIPYGRMTFRRFWNRNHPGAQEYYKKIIRYAVEEIKVDLLHFDNYDHGPGYDEMSQRLFREYLGRTFSEERLKEMGVYDKDAVRPPPEGSDTLLRRAWLDFTCQALADSYRDMAEYARTLRDDILIECNPMGVHTRIVPPVDHGRILQHGEAFWDESRPSGVRNGELVTRIRTYKLARRMNNIAFAYSSTPLEAAEAIAFNLDCLGYICGFEYAKIVNRDGGKVQPMLQMAPYVRFFHERKDLLRGADVVAEVAVLRSFPSQVFAPEKCAALTGNVEQAMIENRVPFQLIYENLLDDLAGYRVLMLAGCVALSDEQIESIQQFVSNGGNLCVIGPVATHDEWMMPRQSPGLGELPQNQVVQIDTSESWVKAVRKANGGSFAVEVSADEDDLFGLCTELTEKTNSRMIHFVNYRDNEPIRDVKTRLELPDGKKATSVTLVSPLREADLAVPFRSDGKEVTFSVPGIDVYEIAVVSFE